MIDIRVWRREDGLEVVAAGHAAYDTPGRDIVCAGVSALLFGFVSYLGGLCRPVPAEAMTAGAPAVSHRVGDGYLRVRTRRMSGADETAWAVTAAGLALIAEAHPTRVRLSPLPAPTGATSAPTGTVHPTEREV